MATATRNTKGSYLNLEAGPTNYGATAPLSPTPSYVNVESPRMSNNNVSIPVGFGKTRAQRRRHRKQRKQRKTRRNRRANRR